MTIVFRARAIAQLKCVSYRMDFVWQEEVAALNTYDFEEEDLKETIKEQEEALHVGQKVSAVLSTISRDGVSGDENALGLYELISLATRELRSLERDLQRNIDDDDDDSIEDMSARVSSF